MKNKLRIRFLLASLALILISLPFVFHAALQSASSLEGNMVQSVATGLEGMPKEALDQVVRKSQEETEGPGVVIQAIQEGTKTQNPSFYDREGNRYEVQSRPIRYQDLFFSLGKSILIFLAFMVLFSILLTRQLYRAALRPFRSMASYLASLTRGDYSVEAPPIEEEEALADLLGTPEDRKLFADQLREIRENENMRRQFTANISHELKSPLTSIIGYAEMIESGKVDEEDNLRFASIIRKEGSRLLTIIDQVIQLSKFDTGMAYMNHLEEFNLTEVIGTELAGRRDYALDHGVDLRARVLSIETPQESPDTGRNQPLWTTLEPGADQPPIYMTGNRRMIEEIVDNLISNAIKYAGSDNARAEVKLSEDENWIHLQVKDNGIGISEEDQGHVFERFFVVNAARTKTDKDGTGLGLSLVKHSVAIHKGWIKLESSLGRGSKFTIGLPKDPKNGRSNHTRDEFFIETGARNKKGDNDENAAT